MVRADDGEFELILGNRQLLSVFFIVVALLGVFFTMGYIVGKNTTPADVLAKGERPMVVDPNTPTGGVPTGGTVVDPRDERPSALDGGKKADPDERLPLVVEAPSQVAERRDPPKETAPPVAEQKPVPAPAKPAAAAASAPTGQAVLDANGEPAPGQTFLQVVASTRPDCEMIASAINRKGYSTVVAPSPKETIFRVLVGPLSGSAQITETRAKLEELGFQKPMLRKY
jgi:cell division septation protein DedD